MAEQVFPTKGNLLNTQKSLSLAKLGYELLDKKRNILIRELMTLVDTAKSICGTIDETYVKAYSALQMANQGELLKTLQMPFPLTVLFRCLTEA